MKRVNQVAAAILFVAAMLCLFGGAAAARTTGVVSNQATHVAAKARKPAPPAKATCSIGRPVMSAGKVRLVGACRYGKARKLAVPVWHWQVLGELDYAGNPLPVPKSALSTGTGSLVPVPLSGGNHLQLKVVLSTRKTKTHTAAVASKSALDAVLGGYTAVGTAPASFTDGWGLPNTAPVCFWPRYLDVADGSPTVNQLPETCQAGAGDCHSQAKGYGWQPLPPGPPADVVPGSYRLNGVSDGVVSSTGLSIYGGHIVCSSGYTTITQLWVRIGYANAAGQPIDSCELPIAGVSSFTVPPQWGGQISFYAILLTFDPAGHLYAWSQWILQQPPYQVRTPGTLEVCQAYHLPPINTSGFVP